MVLALGFRTMMKLLGVLSTCIVGQFGPISVALFSWSVLINLGTLLF